MFNCSIYVTGGMTEQELMGELCNLINGEFSGSSFILTDNYELFIQGNDEFDEYAQKDFPDGFLYFRYILYIEFKEGNMQSYCVGEVASMLNWLWGKGLPAVASCDYEDLLPEGGGYKSKNIPWF